MQVESNPQPLESALTHRDAGFTRIEMMVVLMVLGILVSVVLIGVGGMRTAAADTACQTDRNELDFATEVYFAQLGGHTLPQTGQDNDRYERTLVHGGFLRAPSTYHNLDAAGAVNAQEGSPC